MAFQELDVPETEKYKIYLNILYPKIATFNGECKD